MVPVHLYGQMADMDAILDLADQYGLMVIEDACQAHGAEYFSQEAQSLDEGRLDGRRGGIQFLPREESRSLRRRRRSHHERCRAGRQSQDAARSRPGEKVLSTTSKDTTDGWTRIQAGFLHAKLPHLAKWNAQRRERAAEYNRLLASNEAMIVSL